MQNLCTKSRAHSTPSYKVKTFRNQPISKPNDMVRLCFENVNRLSTSKSGSRSDKFSRLRHIWSKLNVNVASLVETQINPSFLPTKHYLCAIIFRSHSASILSNNANELAGRRKQGSAMLVAKCKISKHAASTRLDPTGLSRWNHIDIVNSQKN